MSVWLCSERSLDFQSTDLKWSVCLTAVQKDAEYNFRVRPVISGESQVCSGVKIRFGKFVHHFQVRFVSILGHLIWFVGVVVLWLLASTLVQIIGDCVAISCWFGISFSKLHVRVFDCSVLALVYWSSTQFLYFGSTIGFLADKIIWNFVHLCLWGHLHVFCICCWWVHTLLKYLEMTAIVTPISLDKRIFVLAEEFAKFSQHQKL